jgi:DNA invertase Pin-like site-specific DNA recombinase
VTTLRVIGYVRVSTDEQGREGVSLALQQAKIAEYCRLYDLDLVRVESDPGSSARTLDRPGIKSALDDLRRAKPGRKADAQSIDGIVIYKLDRLTRSIANWDQLIQEFFNDKIGKRLFSVSDQIDTRTANGRMFLNLIMTIAQWEREIIAERTSDALQGKIRRGERCGKLRFGYDLAPDGRSLLPNEHEQKAIAQMRTWRAAGKTYRDLVRLLEEYGIDTKDGGIWRPATIRQILLRPIA